MIRLFVGSLAVFLAGCGTSPDPSASGQGSPGESAPNSNSESVKTTSEVPPLDFEDVPAALAALLEAAHASETSDFLRTEKWLVTHGDAAVEPLATIVTDEDADLADRIAVCRVLWKMGPAAKPALNETLDSPIQQMRLNAIKGLGLVRPTDDEIIQTLANLMDEGPERVRRETILAICSIGPAAHEICGEKLLALLGDMDENETLRDAAKRALEAVSPRKTFVDP